MRKLIYLADIDLKNSPPVRAQLREDVVQEYAEYYKARVPMPLPHLFQSKHEKWYLVADGLHRIHAQAKLGRKAVESEIHEGTFEDALKFALLANTRHGLRRSNEDKRQCIWSAITMFPAASNSQIAAMAAVDDHTVAAVRKEMETAGKVEPAPVRTAADGKKRKASLSRKSEVEKPQVVDNQGEVLDETGYPIPQQIMQIWARKGEFMVPAKILGQAYEALDQVSKAGNDPLWAGVHIQEICMIIQNAVNSIHLSAPYAVCPLCQGHPNVQPGGVCRSCRGRGFVGRYIWNTIDENLKKVRQLTCKK